jgi:phosphopantothenoylcysteine decarboxylase/phosphopantothenate--cysteine ligase
MNLLQGKRILLGVTGSIAAYKTPQLVRLLKKNGAEVRVALTRSGADFVSPLVLSTLSEYPVAVEFVDSAPGSMWNNHVEWGMWADVVLLAPASAHSIAQSANGLCSNFLSAIVLSAKCPVLWAPAMDLDMYLYPAVQENFRRLEAMGHTVIPAESGELASGLVGQGRMPEPEALVQALEFHWAQRGPAKGKKVLVTLGPTHEPWDSVRYLGNKSSGKMGKALAEAWARQGAEVIALVGPGAERPNFPSVALRPIETALDLLQEVQALFPSVDAGVFAAAVADFRPSTREGHKIKKGASLPVLELVENPDVLAWAGAHKTRRQRVVGFALENPGGQALGREKREKKNCDALFFNSLGEKGLGMGEDLNQGVWMNAQEEIALEPQEKTKLADWMVERMLHEWGWK